MTTLLALVLIVCHLWVVYYVWMEMGLMWSLAYFVLPILLLYIAYVNWHDIKIPFLGIVISSILLSAL